MTEQIVTLRNGHRVWTRTLGNGPGLPLLLLHGGPGVGHDYFEPQEELAAERPVIFYDQLGCGKSDKPDNPVLWTIERFCDEVEEVRAGLGLDQCHILGQSCGGKLLIEYLLRQPDGVVSAVLASTTSSIPAANRELRRLVSLMPEEARDALVDLGACGETNHPDYEKALGLFNAKHLFRPAVMPDCMLRLVANLESSVVMRAMVGPNDLIPIGNMRYWDRSADLDQIRIPVLVTCGRDDIYPPALSGTITTRIANSQMVIFEESTHCAHIEEAAAFNRTVGDFLREVEFNRPTTQS